MKCRATVGLALVLQLAVHGVAWAADAADPDWRTNETLTGDWGGGRTWLQQHGITLEPRLTQFYQGLAAGDGDHGYEYGGKADLRIDTDLGKLGLWNGFSMTIQAEYNFGDTVNGRGGALVPVNTALNQPEIEKFDISSFYFLQNFGDTAQLAFGQINMIEMVAGQPFMGGAGIDSFWNHTFTASPTGTVPPYLVGALLTVRTAPATYRLWIYDPNSYVNRTGLDGAFADGVSVRGGVYFPTTIAGRTGHQGLVAFYSSKGGVDFETLGDMFLPTPSPGTVKTKDSRYYFGYSFDTYLRQVPGRPDEGFGLSANVGVSDGNPNGLRWSMYLGVGGKGLLPGRVRDAWGVGYYYDGISQYAKDAVESVVNLSDEQGLELFYDFSVTPWCSVGADLQVVDPGLADKTAVIPGLRAVLRF